MHFLSLTHTLFLTYGLLAHGEGRDFWPKCSSYNHLYWYVVVVLPSLSMELARSHVLSARLLVAYQPISMLVKSVATYQEQRFYVYDIVEWFWNGGTYLIHRLSPIKPIPLLSAWSGFHCNELSANDFPFFSSHWFFLYHESSSRHRSSLFCSVFRFVLCAIPCVYSL